MVHIPIVIQKDKPSLASQLHLGALLGTLLVGMIVGVGATGNLTLWMPAKTGGQLAGVGSALSNDHGAVGTHAGEDTNVVASGVETFDTANVGADISAPTLAPPSPEVVRASLEVTINEKTLAADRLSLEMLRIKKESVELVAGFNQNCANWNDVCAAPYKESLDKNNVAYDHLVTTLAVWNQEIADARAAIALSAQ